ncbi:MAG: helix-turn-helix domain-containing protein [Candidatus Eremiobacteraeota bacterium]|nr:helix-turn-helix domain-containing protein [Candidatus Eremiobacteraeota bacterium]
MSGAVDALGERIRAARSARGLSLSDVAEQIRIRSVYLAAIEEESWSTIGAPVYIRGFLRTYARFLGLDPEEAVAAFNRTQPTAPPPPGRSGRKPSAAESSRWGSLAIWIAAVVAVLLVAFVVYNELALRTGETVATTVAASATPAPATATPAPVTANPPAGPAAAAGASSLALVLSAPSWLRVTVDGSVSMEGTFPAGTSKTFHGKNALVRIGNAGGVEIYVDGKDVGKLGKAGDVVEHAFTL